MGPPLSVRYNREDLCSKEARWDQKCL